MVRGRGALCKKPRRRIRGSDDEDDGDYVAGEESGDSESSYYGSSEFGDFSHESEAEAPVPPPKRRRSAATRRKAKARIEEETVVARRAGSRRRRSGNLGFVVGDDEVDDDDDDENFVPEDDDSEEAPPAAGRRSGACRQVAKKRKPEAVRKRGRPAASTPARKKRIVAAETSDDELEERVSARKKRKKARTTRRRKKRSLMESESSDSSDSDFVVSDDDSAAEDQDHAATDVTVTKKRRSVVLDRSDSNYVASSRRRKNRSLMESELSDSSDSDFVVSDDDSAAEDLDHAATDVTVRKKRRSVVMDRSDSNYVASEEEVRDPKTEKIVVKTGKEKEADVLEKPVCGICLSEEQKGTVQGALDCCAHFFCFPCIMEWSKVESRCPVCKRRFVTISKSARSDAGFGPSKAVIRVQKRDQVYHPSEEEINSMIDPYENVVCMICQQGGDDNLMLLCDICDSSAHTYCVGLGREVPEDSWYCEGCRSADDGPSNSLHEDTAIEQGRISSDLLCGDKETEMLRTINDSINAEQSASFQGQSSSHRIDLNVSPGHLLEEDYGVALQACGPRASTPLPTSSQHLHARLSGSRPRETGSESSNLGFRATPVDQGTSSSIYSDGMKTEDLNTNMHASTNYQQSEYFPGQYYSQRINLNASPRYLLGEDSGVSSHTSGAVASTLSGRRAIHQRIRILLSNSRPRQIFTTTDVPCRNVENDVRTSTIEQGRGILHIPEGLNLLHTVSTTGSPQQNGRPQSNACLSPSMFSEGRNI